MPLSGCVRTVSGEPCETVSFVSLLLSAVNYCLSILCSCRSLFYVSDCQFYLVVSAVSQCVAIFARKCCQIYYHKSTCADSVAGG